MPITKKYLYYNRNPDNLHLKDCVCRAISTATGLTYDAVDKLLELTSSEYDCDKLCVCCYHNLLDDVLGYTRIWCDYKKNVAEVATEYPNNKLIIRVKDHLTSAIYGYVLDIWDCSSEKVDCFWIVR